MTKASFQAATLNVLYSNTPGQILDDIHKVQGQGADVIGFQELWFSDDRAVLRKLGGNWKTYDNGTGHETAVAWNGNVFRAKDRYSILLSNATNVHPANDGNTSVSARRIAVVELVHLKTGHALTFGSMHPVHDANTNAVPDNNSRGDLYVSQISKATDWVEARHKKGEQLVVVGDMNLNYVSDAHHRDHRLMYYNFGVKNDLWATWRTLGLAKGGTLGKNYFDWINVSRHRGLIPVHHKIVPIHSDHDSVIATIQIGDNALPTPDKEPKPVPEDPDEPYVPDVPYEPAPLPYDTDFPEYCR